MSSPLQSMAINSESTVVAAITSPPNTNNAEGKVEADNRTAFYAQLKAQLSVLHGLLGKVSAGTGWSPSALPAASGEELAKVLSGWMDRLSAVDTDAPPVPIGSLLMSIRTHVLEHLNPLSVGMAASDSGRLLLTCHTVAHLCAVRSTSVLKFRLPQLTMPGSVDALADSVGCLSVAIYNLVAYCPVPPSPIAFTSLPPGSPMVAVMRLVFKFCTDFLREYVFVSRAVSKVLYTLATNYIVAKEAGEGKKASSSTPLLLRDMDTQSAAIACSPVEVALLLKGVDEPSRCQGVLSSISTLSKLPVGFLVQCVSSLSPSVGATLPSPLDAKQAAGASGSQRTVSDALLVLFQFVGALGRITLRGDIRNGGMERTQSSDSFVAALHSSGVHSPLPAPSSPQDDENAALLAEMVSLRIINHPVVAILDDIAGRVDESTEGGRLSLKLLEDILQAWDADLARKVLSLPDIGRAVAEGLLPCLVSSSHAVFVSALQCTGTLLLKARGEVAQEIAPLYCHCLFKVISTPSLFQLPDSHRIAFVEHFTSCFVLPPFSDTTATTEGSNSAHLVHLYNTFDLSPNMYDAELIKGYVVAISEVVNEESDRRAQQAGDGKFSPPVSVAAKASYRAVSQLLQTLASCILRDNEDPCDIELAARIGNIRDNKVAFLGELLKVNEHPTKSLKKKFNITTEEFTQGHDAASDATEQSSLECKDVPTCPDHLLPKVKEIVDFLVDTPALAPSVLSEFLSDNHFLPLQCCREFMRRLSFERMSLAEALCEMLGNLELAKEGQRIERQLEFFTESYFNANKDLNDPNFPFKSMDALYVVVVAVVMLNTDLHNPRVTSKMNATSFTAQLKGCNDGDNFPDGFASKIYEQIKNKPLSKSKSSAPSGPAEGNTKQGGSLFFAPYEDPALQAALQARHKLVYDTHEAVQKRGPPTYSDEGVPSRAVGAEVAKDVFVAIWQSTVENLCVGLASGSYDGDVASDCILGLRSALACASAFNLSTECDSIFERLVHFMRTKKGLAGSCAKAILGVSSSSAALVHFTVKSWRMLMWVLVEVGKGGQMQVDQTDELTWRTIEELVQQVEAQSEGFRETREGAAVVRLFEGLSLAVFHVTGQDAQTFKGCCAAIRKVATFPYVSSAGKRVLGASSYAFGEWLHPTIVRLATLHHSSDEILQLLTELVCSILLDSWRAAHTAAFSEDNQPVCYFGLLRSLFDCAKYARDDTSDKPVVSNPRVKLHVVEGIRALGQQLLTNPKLVRGMPHTVGYEEEAWTVIAQLLGKSMYEHETVGSEVCTVAASTVRSLVTAAADPATLYASSSSPSLLSTILSRLSDAAFLGALCADLTTARVCVPQLVTVSTSSLNSPTSSLQREGNPRKPNLCGDVAMHAMRSLVLLLRSEKNAVRDDAIVAFKQVIVQLHEREVVSCAALVCDLLVATMRSDLSEQMNSPMYHHLAAAQGSASPISHPPTITSSLHVDDEYIARFNALGMTALSSDDGVCSAIQFDRKVIRRASKVAFYTSLPAVLDLLLKDTLRNNLSDVSHAEVASHIATSCLLPAVLFSPSSTSVTSRSLCARFLMDSLSLCKGSTPRPRKWANELGSDADSSFIPAATVLSTIAFIESAVRLESNCIATNANVGAFDERVGCVMKGLGVPEVDEAAKGQHMEVFVAISSVVLGGLPAVLSATMDELILPTMEEGALLGERVGIPTVGPKLFAEVLDVSLHYCHSGAAPDADSKARFPSMASAAICIKGGYLTLLDMAVRWHQPDLLESTTKRLFNHLVATTDIVLDTKNNNPNVASTSGSSKGAGPRQHPMYALLHSVDVCVVAWWEFVSAAIDEVSSPLDKRDALWAVLTKADIFELAVRCLPTHPAEAAIATRTPALQSYLLEFRRRQLV